jgi:hypothetical protein
MTKRKATVSYRAISVATSRTVLFGALTFVVGVLSLPEVMALIPLRYLPASLAFAGFATMCLRLVTKRPVAFIPPGRTKAVKVKRIDTPPVPTTEKF